MSNPYHHVHSADHSPDPESSQLAPQASVPINLPPRLQIPTHNQPFTFPPQASPLYPGGPMYYPAPGPSSLPISSAASPFSSPPLHAGSRPALGVPVPSPDQFPMSNYLQPQLSPYQTPLINSASTSNSLGGMNDYFSPYPPSTSSLPLVSPTWPVHSAGAGPGAPLPGSSTPGPSRGPRTSRQQFTACGACRHRRVKCDLKDRQEEAERVAKEEEREGRRPMGRRPKISCTNCIERNTNCV